eukprot:1385757-Pleurochrysis_carterae.AAC.1
MHERIAAMLVDASKAQRIKAEALEQQLAMPVLHSKLAAGAGAREKALPIAVRVLAHGQLARGGQT